MKAPIPYDPGDFEKEQFRELIAKFEILKKKHARRNNSPLKFVEAFDNFVAAHEAFEPWAWPEIVDKVRGMKDYLQLFTKDYREALKPAEEQAKRNELWDEIYHPPPRFYEGGRADGNGR